MNLTALRKAVRSERQDLLDEALTHPSYANEHPGTKDQARLEFLGDAVLKLALTQALYDRHADADEHELTLRRQALERGDHLVAVGRRLGVDAAVRMSEGERANPADGKRTEDTVEALLGALYLGAGYNAVRKCVEAWFGHELDADVPAPPLPVAAQLQTWAEARGLAVAKQEGPPGPPWTIRLTVDEASEEATAKSKKDARDLAAHALLTRLMART